MQNLVYIAKLSGGKDSTAMCDLLLKHKYPLDYIVFCDTLAEFSEMYAYLDKVKEYFAKKYKFTNFVITKPKVSIDDILFMRIGEKSLTHARFDRKVAFNQALTNEEIKEIPIILNDKKSHILADTDKKNLVVLKRTDTKQTTKIAIHLNYKRKKIINYIVTYSKVNYLDEFNQGIYKKIQ